MWRGGEFWSSRDWHIIRQRGENFGLLPYVPGGLRPVRISYIDRKEMEEESKVGTDWGFKQSAGMCLLVSSISMGKF